MKSDKTGIYEPVDASPVKSFFVKMLTRDITLSEAILDLLDNCVDGVLRTHGKDATDKPYKGFYANIEFDEEHFMIEDNCGGIPWDLHDYAFRMGRAEARPKDAPGTVGVYGIGMKRAIFKMGEDCLITTKNEKNSYEVHITPAWINKEDNWKIPVAETKHPLKISGTTILVMNLNPGISSRFGKDKDRFTTELERMIATHYAFIISKGFVVKLNNKIVVPRPVKLIFNKRKEKKKETSIRPFVFKTEKDGVKVFLTVGFTRPIPTAEETANGDQINAPRSSLDAGWTVVCNDRAVLYCDQTEMTGWGEAGVPRYHTQFIAISGIVEFRSEDPSKLPTTTTKRGIDASSPLYLQVKNKMREGMKLFIDFTNKWKGLERESKAFMEAGEALSLTDLKMEVGNLTLMSTKRTALDGKQFKPNLPLPKRETSNTKTISFSRKVNEIQEVAEYLFNDRDSKPSEVGEECFKTVLREARK